MGKAERDKAVVKQLGTKDLEEVKFWERTGYIKEDESVGVTTCGQGMAKVNSPESRDQSGHREAVRCVNVP